MSTYNGISEARAAYLRKIKQRKTYVAVTQFTILIGLVVLWEVLARLKVIDAFIMSQPSRIVDTFVSMISNNLLMHIELQLLKRLLGFS